MKKKFLSIMLAICMAAAIVPVTSVTAKADSACSCVIKCKEASRNEDCEVCSQPGAALADCKGRVSWTEAGGTPITTYEQLQTLLTPGLIQNFYTYYFPLDADIKVSGGLTVPAGVDFMIDLNGHTLDGDNNGAIFSVSGNLTIIDSKGTGKLTNSSEGALLILDGGYVLMMGGSIEGNTVQGGVNVKSGGTFEMTGGTIKNNTYADPRNYTENLIASGNSTVIISGDAQITCCEENNCEHGYSIGLTKAPYEEGPFLYADGGEIRSIDNGGGIITSTHSGVGTIINGRVRNFQAGEIKAGTYKGEVTNEDTGTISGGRFLSTVTSEGKITSGTFNSLVTNTGTISGGMFSEDSTVKNTSTAYVSGTITGGIFFGIVDSAGGFIEDSALVPVYFVTDAGKLIETVKVLRGQGIPSGALPTPNPVTYGYNSFNGWRMGSNDYTGGGQFINEANYITAKFSGPLTYGITYNLNGGIAENPTSYTADSETFTLNNPVKTGFTFTGWGGTELTGTDNKTVSIAKGSTGTRTYRAYYSENNYTVSFDTAGGSNISDKTDVNWPDTVLENVGTPTKKGYTFTGWKCGNKVVTVDTTYGELADSDTVWQIELTAQWKANDYTVKFDTDGGNDISDKPVIWTDPVLTGISDPTRDGWEFTGWTYQGAAVPADATYGELVGDDAIAGITLVAQWKDIDAPTGEISIGSKIWKTFSDNISFDLFFKTAQEAAITASDNSSGDITIEYLLSDKELSDEELAGATFTQYTEAISIAPNNKYVIYAKMTDASGNAAYINSEGIVLDSAVPVISGVENGKTYCSAQTVTVTEDYIESVKVNDKDVSLDENNQFTLAPSSDGEQKIVVTDKAGNVSAEMTVTVNDGHTYEWQSENGQYWQKCKYCDEETDKKNIPTITINGADRVCVTQDYKYSFTLPEGTTDACYGYEFAKSGDLGLDPIIENNELYGFVSVDWYAAGENSFKVYAGAKTDDGFKFSVSKTVSLLSDHVDDDKNHICDVCEVKISDHTGGEATCTKKAVCEYCGEEYGEIDSSNHNLEHVSEKDATVTDAGNIEYWQCKDCENYFTDEKGISSISQEDTVIAKLQPEIIEGNGQSVTAGEKKDLAFRSNAAFSDFIRVEIDGKTLDEKNYTVKEGSTIVTLKADYVASLSVGVHTLGIVSESGTATTTFTITAKTAADNSIKPVNSGDNSHMALWLALLIVSGGAVVGTTVVIKKRKHSEN